MVESKKAAVELLVAHQEFAKAVEPAVANLHDPATSLFVGMAFFVLDFRSPTHNVGNVTMLFDGVQVLGTSVACVGTQVLAASLGWCFAFDDNGLKRRCKAFAVVHVGPCHGE